VHGLDFLSIVRVEKHDERLERTMIITDNDNVKYPFNELSRYSVRYELNDDVGVLTINYQGIRFA